MRKLFLIATLGIFGFTNIARPAIKPVIKNNSDNLIMVQTKENIVDDTKIVTYEPVAVKKTIKTKIYVHLMPWFETKESNRHPDHPGEWGIHYTMSNKNPDIIVDSSTGRRQVAMYYYPLIGPYASGDKDLIEYQLLLMKLSGIDGVFIDWAPTIKMWDFPMMVSNTEKITEVLDKVGLSFAIVYEDQDINIAFNNKVIDNKIDAAKKDMEYLNKNYFQRIITSRSIINPCC